MFDILLAVSRKSPTPLNWVWIRRLSIRRGKQKACHREMNDLRHGRLDQIHGTLPDRVARPTLGYVPQAMLSDVASAFGNCLTGPRYRTVEEGRIIAFLISPYAIVAGERHLDMERAVSVLERCVILGLPFRTNGSGERLFDPVEVVNGIKHLHFSRGEPIWIERSVRMLRRLMAEALRGAPHDTPPNLSLLEEEAYTVTIRRRFSLAGYRNGDIVRLRLPLPLEGFDNVRVLLPSATGIDHRVLSSRVEVRATVSDSSDIEIGAEVRFTARPRVLADQPSPTETEFALWTRPREGLIKVDSQIRDLARYISNGVDEPWTVMGRLWDYLFDKYQWGFLHYDQIDPADPLSAIQRTCRFDCMTGSAFLASLCRALGLPARLVSGYTLNPVLPTAHSWCEVWLPGSGWAAFDLYSLDLAGGDRDSPWRHHFFGRLDHRFVSERYPLEFCGTGSVRLPRAWQLFSCRRDEGAESTYEALDTGALVLREIVDVVRG